VRAWLTGAPFLARVSLALVAVLLPMLLTETHLYGSVGQYSTVAAASDQVRLVDRKVCDCELVKRSIRTC